MVFFLAGDNTNGRELWVMPGNGVNLPPSAAQNRAGHANAQKHFTLGSNQDQARLMAERNNLLDIEPGDPDQ